MARADDRSVALRAGGRRRRARLAIVLAVAATGAALPAVGSTPPVGAEEAAAPIDTTSLDAVRSAYLNWFLPNVNVAAGWTGSTAGCNAGTTTAAAQQATLEVVNYFRAMGGLNPVTFDPQASAQAQAAALVMAANNSLSHAPPPTWACWSQAAYDGASTSNLYLGRAGPLAIDGYMDDPGAGNTAVGHRRWIMYPEQQVMGAGTTDRSQALRVIGGFGPDSSAPAWVSWPPAGYFPGPLEPFGRWSLSSSDDASFGSATVSVTDPYGNPYPVTVETPQYGYGDDTIVFQVGGDLRPLGSVNRTFDVRVSGVVRGGVATTHTYRVISFDPNEPSPREPSPICGSDKGIAVVPNQAGVAAASLGTGSDVVQLTSVAGTAALACRSSAGGNWYPPVSLGGIITGSPAVARSPSGSLHVFVRGIDAALWTRTRNPSGAWTPWQSLGGIITTSPAVAFRPDGTAIVIARGSDNALWQRTLTTGWVSLGGVIGTSDGFGRLDTRADASIAALPNGAVEIAARGQDSALWRRSLDSGWTALGGLAHSGPAVAAVGSSLHYLVRGIDAALHWRTPTQGWRSLGGIVAPTLAAVARADGALMVLVRGNDSMSWHVVLPSGSSTWSAWTNTGYPG